MGTDIGRSVDTLLDIDTEIDAKLFPDVLRLEHHHARHAARARVCGNDIQRGLGQGADRIEAQVAPQLDPDLVTNISHRRLQSRIDHCLGQRLHAFGFLTGWLAQGEPLAVGVPDNPWLDDLAGRVDNAADRSLRPDSPPLFTVRVDRFDDAILPGALELVEIPPRHTIHHGHHRSAGAEHGLHGIDDVHRGMRLECNDDIVLLAQFRGVVGDRGVRFQALTILFQYQAVGTHRLEVCAARNQGNVLTRPREHGPHETADSPGAVYCNFHLC